jgi:hypothetical protein
MASALAMAHPPQPRRSFTVTIDLFPVHFNRDDAALVRAVQRHPRLAALLPAGIEPLVVAYVTSKGTAAAVGQLTVEAPDFEAMLDADMKAGKRPEPADLVEKYAAAQSRAEQTRAVAQQIGVLPHKYKAQIVAEIREAAATFYDDLADQLDELLDKAAPVVAKLDGIDTADEALDADLGEEWKALKALAAENAEIRDGHLALKLLKGGCY